METDDEKTNILNLLEMLRSHQESVGEFLKQCSKSKSVNAVLQKNYDYYTEQINRAERRLRELE